MKYLIIALLFTSVISAQNINSSKIDLNVPLKDPQVPLATNISLTSPQAPLGEKSGFEKSIGVVDPLRVLEGSIEYRTGIEDIEKELEARKKELQNLERNITKKRAEFEAAAAAMSEVGRKQRIEDITELQLKYQSKLQTAQQYAQGAEEELRTKILRKVQEIVSILAKEIDLKLVLAGGILYAAPNIDLSDKVVERLNKKYEIEQKKIKSAAPMAAMPTSA